MDMIRVVNNNEATLRGRYDGKDYVFPKGKPTDIPLAACEHIFGFGKDDKSQAFNQLGWLVPGRDTIEDAYKKFDRITFLEGRTVYEEPEPEPAARAQTGGRPHVAGPGGEKAPARAGAGASNPT
jgi:hypothetical protein